MHAGTVKMAISKLTEIFQTTYKLEVDAHTLAGEPRQLEFDASQQSVIPTNVFKQLKEAGIARLADDIQKERGTDYYMLM